MTVATGEGAPPPRPERVHRVIERDAEAEGLLRVEEVHEDGALLVRIEVPGVDPRRDVEVSIADGVLHVSARRHKAGKEPGKGVFRSEFRYGEFSRDLALSAPVEMSDLTTEYKAGILELRIPWPDEAARRRGRAGREAPSTRARAAEPDAVRRKTPGR